MAGENSVKIPVSLQLDSIATQISDLRKMTQNGIKIDSTPYKQINTILNNAERNLLNLSQTAKRSFKTPNEIKNFEKSLVKIQNQLGSVSDSFQHLSFDNLTFSDAELEPLKQMRAELVQLETELSNLKNQKVDFNIANESKITNFFKQFNLPKLKIGTSLNAVTNKFEQFNNEITTQIDDTQLALNKINEPGFAATDKFVSNFVKTLNSADITAAWELFAQSNANTAQDALSLLSDQLENYQKGLEDKMNIVNEGEKALDNLTAGRSKRIVDIQSSGIPEVNRAIEEYKNNLLETRRAEIAHDLALKTSSKDFADAQNKIAAASEELERMTKVQDKLNNIQHAVRTWFGFNEILNLTKSTVRNIIGHIRELDDTMTEIAIVTDMTQDQLWGQIETYSALAREYKASIKGVYEVSQLFYQQGMVKYLTFPGNYVIIVS